MKQLLLVFLGGGLGSALRFWISKSLNTLEHSIPFGTLTVNIVGSLLIGVLLGMGLRSNTVSENVIILIAAGFCGGFTTFSAFAYENFQFIKSGDLSSFAIYAVGSLILGITAVILGIWLAKFI